eukprot:Seg924.15 transcript_id=Seg924.15/GoldUCD/mRNA.D3Y31 product="BTB/POZ domain-containing protein 6-B" protein_id=Seg924.15/GoldUCD/D3Y31
MASANAKSVKRGNHTDQQGEERQDISWQESKLALKDRLLHLRNNDFMSDVAFMVQNKRILAHKIFLAASSPVFDAMFNGPLAQKGEFEIEIPDCKDPNAFTEFLRYFYVGESNFDSRNTMTILYLAKKYIVPGLEQSCRSYLARCLNERNIFLTLHWSFRLNDEELGELCMKFICSNIQSLARRENFCQLSLQCLTCILGSDFLEINEIDLFLAVDKWCSKEVERRGASEGGSVTKRSVLGDALYLIRFPVMSSQEFVDHCAYSELLSADESRDIICYINQSERRPRQTAYRHGFPQQQQSNSATLIEEKLKFPKIKRQPVIQEIPFARMKTR